MELAQAKKIRDSVEGAFRYRRKLIRFNEGRFACALALAAEAYKISEFEVLLALYLASGNADFRKTPYIT